MNKIIYHKNKKYYPKKNLGQIFLKDKKIINKIINTIKPNSKDILVEIGPGLGSLTNYIIKYIDKMFAIEFDKHLYFILKNNPFFLNKVYFYQKDVMKFNFFNLLKNKEENLRIFGNLPYNISTNIIFYLLKFRNIIKDMHFMFQKEVANRLIAKPNCKNYGKLSVMAQYYYDIYPIFDISPESFSPIPKVYSTLIRVIPKKNFPYHINISFLETILRKSFGKRRKILSNSLKEIFSCNFLDNLMINSKLRAENISVDQYCKMAFFYQLEKKFNIKEK